MNVLIILHQNGVRFTLSYLCEAKCVVDKIRTPKICLLVLLCIFLKHSVTAQQYEHETDSMYMVLETLTEEDTNRVNALIYMAEVQTYKPTSDVLKYTNEALELAERLDFETGKIEVYFVLAYYYEHAGNSVKAIEYLYKALDRSEDIKDTERMAKCFNYLGLVHKSIGQQKEALEYFSKSLKLWESLKDEYMVALLLENLADIYFHEGNNKLGLENLNKAFEIAKKNNIDIRLGSIYNAFGKVYYKEGELKKAMKYQESALEYATKKEAIILLSWIYSDMSAIYLAQDQPQEAVSSAEKALHFASLADAKHYISDSYQRLYTSLQKLGDYAKAYEYQSKYIALHDSLKNLENVKALERLRYQHEIEVMDGLHKTNILRRNALIGVLVSILIIGFLMHNRRHLLMKKEIDSKRQQLNFSIRNLKEKSELVDKVNKELELFKKNASHDVKIKKFNRVLQLNIVTDDDWENFKEAFEDVYPNFMASVRYHYPNLTTAEIRQAALIKMKLTIKETASVLGITPESVKKSRHRLKKKLELNEDETVEGVLEALHANISED